MEIKVGRGKHATLDAEQAIAFVKEAYDYSGIDKLNVVIEDEDDKEVETIDLLSNAQNTQYLLVIRWQTQLHMKGCILH